MLASPNPDPHRQAALRWQAELLPIYELYCGLAVDMDPESGLGGKLLFAGELNAEGRAFVRAANIAGAASLSVTADLEVQRLIIRDAVVDILVTSLDEALRVVKNEIRKHQGVAVGIAAPVAAIVSEMRERGVLPDLLPPMSPNDPELSEFLRHGARTVQPHPVPSGSTFTAWSNPPANFEAVAGPLLPPGDHASRRWLRLSHRYLGPAARLVRSLACTPEQSARLEEAMQTPSIP